MQRWPLTRSERKHELLCECGLASAWGAGDHVERVFGQPAPEHFIQPAHPGRKLLDNYTVVGRQTEGFAVKDAQGVISTFTVPFLRIGCTGWTIGKFGQSSHSKRDVRSSPMNETSSAIKLPSTATKPSHVSFGATPVALSPSLRVTASVLCVTCIPSRNGKLARDK